MSAWSCTFSGRETINKCYAQILWQSRNNHLYIIYRLNIDVCRISTPCCHDGGTFMRGFQVCFHSRDPAAFFRHELMCHDTHSVLCEVLCYHIVQMLSFIFFSLLFCQEYFVIIKYIWWLYVFKSYQRPNHSNSDSHTQTDYFIFECDDLKVNKIQRSCYNIIRTECHVFCLFPVPPLKQSGFAWNVDCQLLCKGLVKHVRWTG